MSSDLHLCKYCPCAVLKDMVVCWNCEKKLGTTLLEAKELLTEEEMSEVYIKGFISTEFEKEEAKEWLDEWTEDSNENN